MAPFGSPSIEMNIPIRVHNTTMGEVKTLQWVEGSESTWFGRTLRHGRFCVKKEQGQERTPVWQTGIFSGFYITAFFTTYKNVVEFFLPHTK
jgi:hypothetical protein